MSIGIGLVGVVIGAAGVELLRRQKPETIKKVEEAARRFVDSIWSKQSEDDKTAD